MPPEPVSKLYAVYDEYGNPRSEFKRVCVRCRRPILGYSFRTVYGIFIDSDGTRVQVGGESLHDVCPAQDAKPRVPSHNTDEFWGEGNAPKRRRTQRTEKTVETGIMLQSNGRYAVRFNQKRLGTYETIDQARSARDKQVKQIIEERAKSNGSPIRNRRNHKRARGRATGRSVTG